MWKLVAFVFLINFASNAQDLCRNDILDGDDLIEKNLIDSFISHDLSELFFSTDPDLVYGIIGQEHERLLIKFFVVKKDLKNPNDYVVIGKSKAKGIVREFSGIIKIRNVQQLKALTFGVDDEYKGEVESRFLLSADYIFKENKNGENSGEFRGSFQNRFYTTKAGKIKYDNIDIASDGFFNNAFVGTWTTYHDKVSIQCNWGDYRVPASNCDFDIGVAEFSVSEKYIKNGWWVKPKYKWWE